ncbi:MAG: GNAT family N-acetyltransferase [Nitrospirales bacterium]|nr:GNAT family N-acetyltransferase [Nitrospirales bacterium]
MTMDIVRPAGSSDLSRCADLLGILFSQEREFTPDREVQMRGLEMIVLHPETGAVLVFERAGQILGMVALLFTVSTALGRKVALLEDMIVSPELRRQGVGRSLLQAAKEFAGDQGCGRITLLTDSDNEAAHNFYLRNGFSRSDMVVFRNLS